MHQNPAVESLVHTDKGKGGTLEAGCAEVIGSRFIHFIRTDSNVFLFMDEKYSIVYMYHNFLIHSSAKGHLDMS